LLDTNSVYSMETINVQSIAACDYEQRSYGKTYANNDKVEQSFRRVIFKWCK